MMSCEQDKEGRPTLKAKRFNKFESESPLLTPKIKPNDSSVAIKYGIKRKGSSEEESNLFQIKRPRELPSIGTLPADTKNLANGRLQKLRNKLQAELSQKDNISSDANKNIFALRLSKRENSRESNILENTNNAHNVPEESVNKWMSKPNFRSGEFKERERQLSYSAEKPKELANQRLKNLKKRLSDSINIKTTSVSESNQQDININNANGQTSTSKTNENVTMNLTGQHYSRKRNITEVNTENDLLEDISASKRISLAQNTLSIISNINKGYSDVDLRDVEKLASPTDLNSSLYRKNYPFPQIDSNSNTNVILSKKDMNKPSSECVNPSTSLTDQLLKSKKDNTSLKNITSNEIKDYTSPMKKVSEENKICVEKNPKATSSFSLNDNDNFQGKMAMTASWIMSHQNLNSSVNNTLNKSDDSLLNVYDANTSNQTKFLDETEDMEWTNAEPDNEIIDPQVNAGVEEKQENKVQKDKEEQESLKLPNICIVVDTNVFISGLSKIRDLVDMKITGKLTPLIYIPWMVITELDYMKESCSEMKLKKNIINSIKYINKCLEEGNPKVIGQTLSDVDKQIYVGSAPDDKIISCCFQVNEKYESVILLSNDVNLKNKALINSISACSTNEIMMKIMSKLSKNTKCQKVMHRMGILCSSIICECAKEAFGNIWTKMDSLSCPPWSLVDCLKRFKKYWGTVFKEKLMKQFTKTMDDLLVFLQNNKYICDESDEFIKFMKLCVTLCIFLKDIEECRGLVENTMSDITKLC